MIDQAADEIAPQHGIDPAVAKAMAQQILEQAAEKQITDAERRAKRRGKPGMVGFGGGKTRVEIPEEQARAFVGWLLGRVK